MASARGSRRAPRRPPTWEISDSDTEGPAGAEASTGARAPPARALRPEQALRRLAVGVDPALLEDPGADVLLEALGALGCQCLLEPQRRARSLRWSGAALDPCPRGELPEEQELLLLEPEEFVQGVAGLLQVLKGPRPAPRRTPCFPARLG